MVSEAARSQTLMYEAELEHIPSNFSTLLERYAKVPQDLQISHVLSLRNRAYESHPYPCLGRFRFMDLDLSNHPRYPEILSRLKLTDEPELLLDFGCCIGQDVRKLLLDGAPVSKIYGSDLLPEFIEIGYELFRDVSTFPRDHFIAPADAFDETSNNALAEFDGKVSILHISAVFHLFGIEDQRKLARRCLKLLSPKKKCLVLGGQTANVNAGSYPRANGQMRWRHNSESWAQLWEDAAREHGGCTVKSHSVLDESQMNVTQLKDTSWAKLDRSKIIGWMAEGFRWMIWWTEVEIQA